MGGATAHKCFLDPGQIYVTNFCRLHGRLMYPQNVTSGDTNKQNFCLLHSQHYFVLTLSKRLVPPTIAMAICARLPVIIVPKLLATHQTAQYGYVPVKNRSGIARKNQGHWIYVLLNVFLVFPLSSFSCHVCKNKLDYLSAFDHT